MKARLFASALALLASGILTSFGPQRLWAQDQPEGVEVLTRGPVHEAFAEPITLAAAETIVIEKEPPQAIEELPPDARPEGENVIWISGYWAWDDEREDFLWVSGVWRDAPPNQEWVPGYWSPAEAGYHWTPGFWASTEIEEVSYLPQPPQTIEEGPTGPLPSEDHFWVPGVWRYRDYRYVWRPGYYHRTEPDWVWMPAHYVWCPSGFIYVDGYWDYPLARRGVLFAPVYFSQPIYTRPAYYYSPSIVINTSVLSIHLFTRPSYCHYYFGDYYGSHYAEVGYYPWFAYHSRRHSYDPLFVHDRWQHGRRNRDWEHGLQERFEHYRDHEDDRPVHTFAALSVGGGRGRGRDNVNFAVSLNQVVSGNVRFNDADGRSSMRFERLQKDRRDEFRKGADRMRQFAERRVEVEKDSNRATKERSARQSLRLDGRAQARIDDDPNRGRGDDRGPSGDRGRNRDGDGPEGRGRSGSDQVGNGSFRGRDVTRDAAEGTPDTERERGDRGSRDTARTGAEGGRTGRDSLEDVLRSRRAGDAARDIGRSGPRDLNDLRGDADDGDDASRRLRGLGGRSGDNEGRDALRAKAEADAATSDLQNRIERDAKERAGREGRSSRSGDAERLRIGGGDDAGRGDSGAAAAELRSRIQRQMREGAGAEDRGSRGGDVGRQRIGEGDSDPGRSDIRRETPDVGGDRSGIRRDRPDSRPLEGSGERSGRGSKQLERRFDGPDAGGVPSGVQGSGAGNIDRLRRRDSGGSDSGAASLTRPGNDGASIQLNRPDRGSERSGSPDIRTQIPGLGGDRNQGGERASRMDRPETRSRSGRESRSDAGAGAVQQQVETMRRATESRRSTPPATGDQSQIPGAGTGVVGGGSAPTATVVPNIESGQDRGRRGDNDGRRGRGRRD